MSGRSTMKKIHANFGRCFTWSSRRVMASMRAITITTRVSRARTGMASTLAETPGGVHRCFASGPNS